MQTLKCGCFRYTPLKMDEEHRGMMMSDDEEDEFADKQLGVKIQSSAL
jgi:hypothetical protein